MNIAKIKSHLKSINITTLVLWLLIIIGIVLRAKVYFYNQSFGVGECMLGVNINEIGSNYLKYFEPLKLNQCAPPLFLIVCRLILDISHQAGHFYNQDLMLRLFPFLCSVASLPLFAILLTKIATNKHFIWASMAMLVFNQTAIRYAQEFKQYSCEMMFTLILLLMFNSLNLKEISYKKLGTYVSIFVLSMWFSSSAILILFVGYLFLAYEVFKNKIFDKVKLSILLVPILANVIVYYFAYYKPVKKAMVVFMHNFWANRAPSFFTFSNFSELFVKKMQALIYSPCSEHLILFLIFSLVIFFLNKEINAKIKFIASSSVALIILSSFLSVYPFEERLILFLLPMFIIIYSQISYLLKENKLILVLFACIVVNLFNQKLEISSDKLANSEMIKCQFRKYAEFIVENKIEPQQILMTPNCQIEYYLQNYLNGRKFLFKESLWINLKKSKLSHKLNEISKGNYWMFFPVETRIGTYTMNAIQILENNPNIRIIEINKEKNTMHYIIHFEKI